MPLNLLPDVADMAVTVTVQLVGFEERGCQQEL